MNLSEESREYRKTLEERNKFKAGEKVFLHKIDCNILLEEGYKVGDVVTLTYIDPYEGWHGVFPDGEEWSLVDCIFHRQESIPDNVNRRYPGEHTASELDNVNSPKHYSLLGNPNGVYEARHEIMARHPEVSSNIMDEWSRATEYLLRMFDKNGLEDAKKARWYLNKLIERMEENG